MFLHGLGNDDLWKADPGEEHEFHVEDNPFAFSQGQLSKEPRSLLRFGRIAGACTGYANGQRLRIELG
jgi:P-type Ca2+ transporter type 2C